MNLLHGLIPRVVRFTETEWWLSGSGEWQCLMGTEFQFRKMKKVQEMDDGDGCTTV